jgi:hypothetical protein
MTTARVDHLTERRRTGFVGGLCQTRRFLAELAVGNIDGKMAPLQRRQAPLVARLLGETISSLAGQREQSSPNPDKCTNPHK